MAWEMRHIFHKQAGVAALQYKQGDKDTAINAENLSVMHAAANDLKKYAQANVHQYRSLVADLPPNNLDVAECEAYIARVESAYRYLDE